MDDTPIARVKKRCRYRGCITFLNQEKIGIRNFCRIHEGKVQRLIDEYHIDQSAHTVNQADYKRYLRICDKEDLDFKDATRQEHKRTGGRKKISH